MNANIAGCVICSKPLPAASAATDGPGFPVHEQCYALVTRIKGIKGDGTTAIRCPYCTEDKKFKLMNARADGEWFLCPPAATPPCPVTLSTRATALGALNLRRPLCEGSLGPSPLAMVLGSSKIEIANRAGKTQS